VAPGDAALQIERPAAGEPPSSWQRRPAHRRQGTQQAQECPCVTNEALMRGWPPCNVRYDTPSGQGAAFESKLPTINNTGLLWYDMT
jgi:hypothetical protein